ncbi:DNA-methyltransferase [Bacillus altitudinis]|uniref:DNA-methyltransferase n=1 Tax=Bacillus altitudinis TaxID=293387 RepID=UPI003D1D274B
MFENKFFKVLGIRNKEELSEFSRVAKVPQKKLKYYNEEVIFPIGEDLRKIIECLDISELELRLKLGIIDNSTLHLIEQNSSQISKLLKPNQDSVQTKINLEPAFKTDKGTLYQADCIDVIRAIPNESVDMIFADPPFNLDKVYESEMNDNLTKEAYLKWTEEWLLGCINLLKEGGSLFIWNLPYWNTYTAEILNKYLTFRHWIAAEVKYRLPIKNKLYPAHYSLLYYTKGDKPATFNQERLPLEICRHCGGDIKDYGGYKDKLNLEGITLSDVWKDISPVRHSKYKTRDSNQLPVNLLERVISLSTNEDDVIFDPFGGSGTTYIVSEALRRNWIGSEIGPIDSIVARFKDIDFHKDQIKKIQNKKNILFTEEMRSLRRKKGHWLPETLGKKH